MRWGEDVSVGVLLRIVVVGLVELFYGVVKGCMCVGVVVGWVCGWGVCV